jgi:hypothetical protein
MEAAQNVCAASILSRRSPEESSAARLYVRLKAPPVQLEAWLPKFGG